MAARANQKIEWQSLARKANYSTATLAKLRRVSCRQLERTFLEEFRQCPELWLNRLRLRDARVFLEGGGSPKVVAIIFGYRHYQSFSRAFKGLFGVSPSFISLNSKDSGEVEEH